MKTIEAACYVQSNFSRHGAGGLLAVEEQLHFEMIFQCAVKENNIVGGHGAAMRVNTRLGGSFTKYFRYKLISIAAAFAFVIEWQTEMLSRTIK